MLSINFLENVIKKEIADAIEKTKQLKKDEITMQDYCEHIDWMFIDEMTTEYVKACIESEV